MGSSPLPRSIRGAALTRSPQDDRLQSEVAEDPRDVRDSCDAVSHVVEDGRSAAAAAAGASERAAVRGSSVVVASSSNCTAAMRSRGRAPGDASCTLRVRVRLLRRSLGREQPAPAGWQADLPHALLE